MTDWIIPANPATFDVNSAFLHREEIDWSEAANAYLEAGDRVFLYQVAPVSAITHSCEVIRTGISSSEMFDDREYWRDSEAFAERQDRTWMRLGRTRTFGVQERSLLTLNRLRDSGMQRSPQGRSRAPAAVSTLVERVIGMIAEHAAELIAQERDLLSALGYPRAEWRFRRGGREGTTSFASYSAALEIPDAATALALLQVFVDAAGLRSHGGWAISALPSWSGPTDKHRLATISGSQAELFYVWIESSSGNVSTWGVRLPSQYRDTLSRIDGTWFVDPDNGDVIVNGETVQHLLEFLDDNDVLTAIRRTVTARAIKRRGNWHNPYLAALLAPSSVPELAEGVEPSSPEEVEFERRYIERVARVRQHQAPLRRAALRYYAPPACHYCGLDVVEVLDVAHILPDSEGGAASVGNVRLLCANHHRAFDRALLAWNERQGRFDRAPESVEVPPAPLRPQP